MRLPKHSRVSWLVASIVASCVLLSACGKGETAQPPGDRPSHANSDRAVYGWYAGLPIHLYAATPSSYGGDGPDAPSEEYPDVTVYLHAPVTDEVPHGPAVDLPPAPDGRSRHLPPHMDTLPFLIAQDRPHDAIGMFVTPGPRAKVDNVRSVTVPENSVTAGPLVREIKVGTVWVPINNHAAIEWGIARGLLRLVPFEYGGIMWTKLPNDVPLDTISDAGSLK